MRLAPLDFPVALGSIAVVFNASLVVWQVWRQFCPPSIIPAADLPAHSYVGQDYPLKYPMIPLDTVAITLHESVHFSLNFSDPMEEEAWFLYSMIPKGTHTRLGPQQRVFAITVSHQLHCLRRIYLAFANREDERASAEHVNHCLNYLRQTLLCEATDTLERGDFMERDYESDRVGGTLVCKDWEKAFQSFDEKWAEWVAWREVWN
ncbi:hypothetical protein B0H13DRAFT_2394080 [Mycena leptocephala]|nr:hypothetical protein B0H13DRAFT_2394080 [Mycena leptocephala]